MHHSYLFIIQELASYLFPSISVMFNLLSGIIIQELAHKMSLEGDLSDSISRVDFASQLKKLEKFRRCRSERTRAVEAEKRAAGAGPRKEGEKGL